MRLSTLRSKVMHRAGSSSRSGWHSVDFTVDGKSLLGLLSAAAGGHADFMGCFASGFPESNRTTLRKLTLKEPPDTPRGGVLIYLCPQCGDIGCGAYSVIVDKDEGKYIWRDFAYENGYEAPHPLQGIGPFEFDVEAYQSELATAST